MLTTKAYITKVPEDGDNKFQVNIPLMSDNVSEEAIFDALLCSTSGNYNDYKVGDCVFVDFEDDKYNTAIIMGKLYTEVPEENEAYGLFNELKVTGTATLPVDTKLGPYSAEDIFNLYQAVSNMKEGDFLDDDTLLEYLKLWVKKSEFNTFYGDEYFNNNYPYIKNVEFGNELEYNSGTTQTPNWVYLIKDAGSRKKYNPDYKSFKDDWIDFMQTKFNKFLGQNYTATGNTRPSFTQFLINVVDNGTWDSEGSIYFPNYTQLVNAVRGLSHKYVQFKESDSTATGKYANIIRVMKGKPETGDSSSLVTYTRITTKDPNTLYFLTNLPE